MAEVRWQCWRGRAGRAGTCVARRSDMGEPPLLFCLCWLVCWCWRKECGVLWYTHQNACFLHELWVKKVGRSEISWQHNKAQVSNFKFKNKFGGVRVTNLVFKNKFGGAQKSMKLGYPLCLQMDIGIKKYHFSKIVIIYLS